MAQFLKQKLRFLLAITITLILTIVLYRTLSPTKIALINLPEYMYVKMAKSNDSRFIKLKYLKSEDLPNLKSYNMIMVFGMGMNLPAAQEVKLQDAINEGVPVYVFHAGGSKIQTSNIEGKNLNAVTDYFENAGTRNYRNLFYYIRKELGRKKLFVPDYEAPIKYGADVLFHIDEDAIFDNIPAFEKYCADNKFHTPGAKKIVLFTSVPGPFNANREHLDEMITELQNRGYNVYPASTSGKRLDFIQQINPALIVYMPHGRFGTGSPAAEFERELVKLNVPVICPVSVLNQYEDWVKDPQGMSGGFLSQSITMPEFDGEIIPYAVVAQYKDENGLLIFKTIPDRLKNFGNIIDNYINLKTLPNADKKIAIIYYKGHGKGAGEAAGLEVIPSVYNTLKRLQAEGYNTGVLPATAKEFERDLMTKAPLLGPYAEGAFDAYLKTGYAEPVKKEDYEQWCNAQIPAEMYKEVTDRYGNAPGSYMAFSDNSGDFLAIARARYGNVVILPQPMPGLGGDGFALVHGAKVAPPHSYIAPYLWLQNSFKANAIIHFGTHGSLEFTPGKQVALSNYDWADMLIGTMPHFYPYISNDPGEAVMAKRRSYATILTHITPPFIESMVLSNKKIIRDKIAQYERSSGNLKYEYAKSIRQIAMDEGFAKDLGFDTVSENICSEDEMLRLINYLDEMDNERITAGLYTLGNPYTERHIESTVMLMSSNEIAYSLLELDKQKGLVTPKQAENKYFFTTNYLQPAKTKVTAVYKAGNAGGVFQQTVSPADFQRTERWQSHSNAAQAGNPAHRSMAKPTKEAAFNLEELVVKIAADPKQKDFVAKLSSQKEYERAIGLLDPQKRANAKQIARLIPAMREAIEIAESENIQQLLTAIKDTTLKTKALHLLNDPTLAARIEEQKQVQNKALLEKAASDTLMTALTTEAGKLEQSDIYDLKKLESKLNFYKQHQTELLRLTGANSPLAALLKEDSFSKITDTFTRVLQNKEETEKAFTTAVFSVKTAFDNIQLYKQQLLTTPQSELDGIVNALSGGFIAPSPGGDVLNNPAILPTGRNVYSINAEQTPTKEAWKVGQKLADQMLADFHQKNGKYPLKVSYTLWSSEFIESEGATIAQIFQLLGVEPIWDAYGRVKDLRLMTAEELQRPRIDVVVQTSGQLRDIAASRLYLIQKAIGMAASDNSTDRNFVQEGVLAAKKRLLEKGFSPKDAEALSKTRVFGGINGSYGAGNFTEMVEKSDAWEKSSDLAQNFMNNMGATYGDENAWGEHKNGVFEAALLNTEAVVQPRQSNTWGPLSLDHMYEFMGGMNLAIKEVTGNDAESYLSDYRNSSNPRMQGLKEGIWSEARTTLLNPRYIQEYMNGGTSAAETFAETFRNTFGWNATKPSVIENRLWDELYDTYIKDKQQLGIQRFFEQQNPYALQEMTAVMLETVRKGLWKATDEQVNEMVKLHTELVKEHDAGCSGFVCDNPKLRKMIAEKLPADEAKVYNDKIDQALAVAEKGDNKAKVLKKEEKQNKQQAKVKTTPEKQNRWMMILAGVVVFAGAIVYLRIRNNRKQDDK